MLYGLMNARQQKAHDDDLCNRFYAMMAMAGARELKGAKYEIEIEMPDEKGLWTWAIQAHARADERTIEYYGSKLRALKLLRHASLAAFICSRDPTKFGIINQSFFAVAARWPMLRGKYEEAKHGLDCQGWFRYSKKLS